MALVDNFGTLDGNFPHSIVYLAVNLIVWVNFTFLIAQIELSLGIIRKVGRKGLK